MPTVDKIIVTTPFLTGSNPYDGMNTELRAGTVRQLRQDAGKLALLLYTMPVPRQTGFPSFRWLDRFSFVGGVLPQG
jgi:hypothetical protein